MHAAQRDLGTSDNAQSTAALLIERGQQHAARGQRRAALEFAERAASMQLTSPAHQVGLGLLFVDCNEALSALALFERATAAEPENLEYLYYLAVTQRLAGDATSAEANLDIVLHGRPDFYGAYYVRSDLRTQSLEHNHIAEMTRILAGRLHDRRAETLLCFAVAKELEDVGRFDRSFQYLKRGCDTHRRFSTYDVTTEIALIDNLIRVHTPEAVHRRPKGLGTSECIFIIGLPRTGTTVVERILSSHPDVHAAGELPTFPLQLAAQLQRRPCRSTSPRDIVASYLHVNPRELGRAYLEATRPQTGRTARFTDKLPLNYLYAGVIHRALPKARFILLMRHPMDACYAIYRTLFTGAYLFSYDLCELGRYYVAWSALMQHWRVVLGNALLVVQYERLITDQEYITREILSHCGLPWDERCLAFHKERGPVDSASALQVRRPLYSSSIGKWRNYARHLKPLMATLENLGLQVGGTGADATASDV